MKDCCKRALIIDTHFSTEASEQDGHILSDIELHEDLKGRWYVEYQDDSPVKIEDAKWTSWENRRSFWPIKSEIVRCLTENGFASIFEVFDSESPIREKQRSTFLAVR